MGINKMCRVFVAFGSHKMALCSVDVVNDTHATTIFEPKKCPIFVVFRCSVNGIVASSRVSTLTTARNNAKY